MKEKYYVIKQDDLSKIFAVQPDSDTAVFILADLKDAEVKDAVVIRKQDVFAGPALHGYAASIAVVIKEMESLSVSRGIDLATETESLQSIADYFEEMAEDADASTSQKLPD